MLNWVVTLLITALIAALLGFGGIAGAVVAGMIGRGGRSYGP
jgi:uncharacterized membrane protein YtjA (UPF0391 family)